MEILPLSSVLTLEAVPIPWLMELPEKLLESCSPVLMLLDEQIHKMSQSISMEVRLLIPVELTLLSGHQALVSTSAQQILEMTDLLEPELLLHGV